MQPLDARLELVADTWIPDRRLPPRTLWATSTAVLALAAIRVGGWTAALAVLGLAALVPLLGPGLARRRLEHQARRLLPERCTAISRAVRSGAGLAPAVAEAFPSDGSGAARWSRAMDEVAAGRPFDEAITAIPVDGGAEQLLVNGLRIGWGSGGPIAAGLEVLAARLHDEVVIGDRERVLTTQARSSAGVLAVLPVAFALVLSAVRGAPLWNGAPALVAAGVGVLLNVVGVLWMRRLLRTGP